MNASFRYFEALDGIFGGVQALDGLSRGYMDPEKSYLVVLKASDTGKVWFFHNICILFMNFRYFEGLDGLFSGFQALDGISRGYMEIENSYMVVLGASEPRKMLFFHNELVLLVSASCRYFEALDGLIGGFQALAFPGAIWKQKIHIWSSWKPLRLEK